jgi:hypothetical protein
MDLRIKVIQFKTEYKTGKEPVDWVEFTSGDAMSDSGVPMHSTWEQVRRITPPDFIENDDGGLKLAALRSQWNQIEPHYLAWKSGQDIPESGTALGAWPGVNADQAEALRGVGLKTVEAVAAVGEAILSRPPLPNMREIKRQAALWLEGQDGAIMSARVAELEAQNAAMLEMLAEKAEVKRGPGRPPKQAEEVAA